MPLRAPAGPTREKIPKGNYDGRCVAVVDLGIQQGEYEGKPWRRHQLFLRFELEGGYRISTEQTLSFTKKANLRQWVSNWMYGGMMSDEEADEFEFDKLVGLPVKVGVGETTGGNHKIIALGQTTKEIEVESNLVFVEDGAFIRGAAEDLPPWVVEKIGGSDDEDEEQGFD